MPLSDFNVPNCCSVKVVFQLPLPMASPQGDEAAAQTLLN